MPDVTETENFDALTKTEQDAITDLRARNILLRNTPLGTDRSQWGPDAAYGMFGIRSSHGIESLTVYPYFQGRVFVTRFPKLRFPQLSGANFRIRFSWMAYAESVATEHAQGQIPTLIEFSGTGGGRILFDYVRDLFYYSDHYVTYTLILDQANGGLPLRSM